MILTVSMAKILLISTLSMLRYYDEPVLGYRCTGKPYGTREVCPCSTCATDTFG